MVNKNAGREARPATLAISERHKIQEKMFVRGSSLSSPQD